MLKRLVTLDSESQSRIIGALRDCDFDEKNCARRLGQQGLVSVSFVNVPRPFFKSSGDALDCLIALFLMNERVELSQVESILTPLVLSLLTKTNLLTVSADHVQSHLNLFPCTDAYFATDLKKFNPEINQVMWLYPESYMLAGAIARSPIRAALDLCTGSGIHAILASRHCEKVIGVDINPRAIEFANFNKWLNDASRVDFRLGDLYEPTSDEKFDLILANPPYNPSSNTRAGSNWYSGGSSGEEIISRVIGGLDQHLTKEGSAYLISLWVTWRNQADYASKLDEWLHGQLSHFDILFLVRERNPNYREPYSEITHQFERLDFGFLAIRRARNGRQGTYQRVVCAISEFASQMKYQGMVGHALIDHLRCSVS